MKHADTIGRMTLEQKCALLSGETAFDTRAYPELGIPSLSFSDGPHGLRHQSEGANHLGIGGSDPATCFPTAVTIAQSWDPQLAQRVGAALAEEAATMGVNVMLGPGLCIKRSPLCGRNFEYFSEDPLVSGKMAAGYVRGMQERGLAACPKHFAVNSQETRRQASDSVLDERTLREIYLAGFETVVREAHPKSIMSSYNLVNGTYANENHHLLQEILRDEWGFDGAVVTDWGGSNDHVAGVREGSAFEMPNPDISSARELAEAVRAGKLSEAAVDACVDDALELILTTDAAKRAYPAEFDAAGHHKLAREAAEEGMVLLKNEPGAAGTKLANSPLLPLAAGTSVALVGDFAQTPRYQGAGSSLVNATQVETLLDAMKASADVKLVGFEPGFQRGGDADETLAAAVVDLAGKADVVVCCLGLDESKETEGADRMDMKLAQNQIDLLARVAQVNPNVVVVLSAGSCVETGWAKDARALLYLGLSGQAGGSATLAALTGAVNPCGKLAETWPVRLEDTPTYGNFPSEARAALYREGLYVGYRYYQTAGVPVAFPFGYGLSYTSFAYGQARAAADGNSVTVRVSNEGQVCGTEVVQVYVHKPNAQVFRPAQVLAGFARVTLEPGEAQDVTVQLDPHAFMYFNVRTSSWEREAGTYNIGVGASCEDIRATAAVELAGTGAPDPYAGLSLDAYRTGKVAKVSDAEFSALLGHALPAESKTIDQSSCFRDMGHSRSPSLWAVSQVLKAMDAKARRAGKPNINVLFIYNMPLRALGKMVPGLGMNFVNAVVREARGWGLAGIIPALVVQLLAGKGFVRMWLLWVLAPIAVAIVANAIRNRPFVKAIKE